MSPRAGLSRALPKCGDAFLDGSPPPDTDSPGAPKPQPISGFLPVPRACRDGPPGRLYGALHSSEILAKGTRIFGLVIRMLRINTDSLSVKIRQIRANPCPVSPETLTRGPVFWVARPMFLTYILAH